jgi:hypothetical protein
VVVETLQQVKPTSWAAIERHTIKVLAFMYPDCLTSPTPTPVEHFIEIGLSHHLGIELNVREDLPMDVEGVLIPRKNGDPPRLHLPLATYEGMHAGNRRDRFTAAHECGHAVLHSRQITEALVSGKSEGLFRRRRDIPSYRDPECQANVFASRFLIPGVTLRMAIQSVGLDVVELADIFKVSKEAMLYRLRDIGAL